MILVPPRNLIIPGVRCLRCGKLRTRRSLRTPRRVTPRWSRLAQLFNAGDKLQVDSANKLQISSDSKLIVAGDSDPCCCGTSGCCAGGSSPASWTATFSGITYPFTSCTNHATGMASSIQTGDPNTTFTANRTGPSPATDCDWQSSDDTSFTATGYALSGCAGTPAASLVGVWVHMYLIDPTTIAVSLTYHDPETIGAADIFYTEIEITDCVGPYTGSNVNTGSPAGGWYGGYGGSVTISSP